VKQPGHPVFFLGEGGLENEANFDYLRGEKIQ